MKKVILMILAILILAMGAVPAFAAAPQKSVGTISDSIGIRSFNMINDGESRIINNGDGSVTITGWTSTYYAVDSVKVTLNLQKYTSSGWATINSYTFTDYNSDYVSGAKTLAVTPGEYRVNGVHEAEDGFSDEKGLSYSGSIFVD